MPNFDGTGPNGMGSMTGGGFGRCNPNNRISSGFTGRKYGFGRQGIRRCGRGGFRFWANNPDITTRDYLEEQKKLLENELELINKELEK